MSYMSASGPTTEDIVRWGEQVYEQQLRHALEPQHSGKYVVINVEKGEYELDSDHLAASDRAATRWPEARLYATRVGSRSLGRI